MHPVVISVLIVVALAVIYFMRKSKPAAPVGGDEMIIYGTMGCGWTKKQLKYCDDKGLKYKFVNCESETCPESVKGYPTIIHRGETIEGYKEM
jgi:glutaredoxin